MDVFPAKPNHTVPNQTVDPHTIEDAQRTLNSLAVLHDTGKAPTERFALPVTGNMEYGFFNAVMVRGLPRARAGRGCMHGRTRHAQAALCVHCVHACTCSPLRAWSQSERRRAPQRRLSP